MRVRKLQPLLLGGLVLLIGCSNGLPEYSPYPPESLATSLKERTLCLNEWRDAWRLQEGTCRGIDMGPVPPDSVLRLGFLSWSAKEGALRVRVYVGDRRVADLVNGPEPMWCDHSVDLTAFGESGESCHVVFDAQHSFALSCCEIVPRHGVKPNVLVYLIDTLRQDHVACYGYERDTSPNIDALAGRAVRFTHLVPQSSWTKPSVASLLTSTYPNTHGAQDRPDMLRPNLPKLATVLEEAGYETHGFTTNIHCRPLWGFGNEFYRYVDVDSDNWRAADDAKPVNVAIDTFRGMAGRPWFMFVHTMGPHDPYEPPKSHAARFQPERYEGDAQTIERQKAIDLYDAEIAYSDEQFGRLLDELRQLGMYDNTLILLVSDHGEEFWEHGGQHHGNTLFEEVLRVPLVIKLPGGARAGQTCEALVENVDIAPTIAELVGATPDPRFQGTSFVHLLDEEPGQSRIGYASLFHEDKSIRAAKTCAAKYVHNMAKHETVWYDLLADPAEKDPLDQPIEGAERLEPYVTLRSMQGAQGLHVLITCGDGENRHVEGSITSAKLGKPTLRYHEWKGNVEKVGDTVHFDMQTKHKLDKTYRRDEWHDEVAEQDNAHLYVDCPPDAELVFDVTVDGQPIAPSDVFVGGAMEQMVLEQTTLTPASLVAEPDAFDPAALPRRFAMYVWYVPAVETVADDELTPEVRDALRALGYLE